jgi:hypothetical protein
MMATIDEFLKSGQLGGLASGLSMEEVRGVLGDPEDVSVKANPAIWKYGALQLSFSRGPQEPEPSVSGIFLYFNNTKNAIPSSLCLTGWLPTIETSVGEFRDHLADAGLETPSGVLSAPVDRLVLPSGVGVTFDDGRLHSISYLARREPQVKQLTVSIPLKDLEIIRKEAESRRISMSALCSEWIREHISSRERVEAS